MPEAELGRIYRGKLVGYARSPNRDLYAVLDTGPTLTALLARDSRIAPGRDTQARAVEIEDEKLRRRILTWRLDDLERSIRNERVR